MHSLTPALGEGFTQLLLLTVTGLENSHQSTAASPFPNKLIPGQSPHPDLDHQLESFLPHLVLALLLKVPAGTGHGGTEASWRPWFSLSLFQRASMGLGGLLYWDGAAGPVAHSTHPARARVAEGTVNTVPRWSLDRGKHRILLLERQKELSYRRLAKAQNGNIGSLGKDTGELRENRG